MPTHLLAPRRHAPRPALQLMEGVALARGRLHEACGPARHRFALWLAAAAAPGAVLWLPSPRGDQRLNPDGMAHLASPARLLFVQTLRSEQQLWAMEESLRSGAAALVVAETDDLPSMTAVRRLHLAAENAGHGSTDSAPAPLGLLLTPGEGGAQGIETRWHLAPAHHLAATALLSAVSDPPAPHPARPAAAQRSTDAPPGLQDCWRLQRLRARMQPPRDWLVSQSGNNPPVALHRPPDPPPAPCAPRHPAPQAERA